MWLTGGGPGHIETAPVKRRHGLRKSGQRIKFLRFIAARDQDHRTTTNLHLANSELNIRCTILMYRSDKKVPATPHNPVMVSSLIGLHHIHVVDNDLPLKCSSLPSGTSSTMRSAAALRRLIECRRMTRASSTAGCSARPALTARGMADSTPSERSSFFNDKMSLDSEMPMLVSSQRIFMLPCSRRYAGSSAPIASLFFTLAMDLSVFGIKIVLWDILSHDQTWSYSTRAHPHLPILSHGGESVTKFCLLFDLCHLDIRLYFKI